MALRHAATHRNIASVSSSLRGTQCKGCQPERSSSSSKQGSRAAQQQSNAPLPPQVARRSKRWAEQQRRQSSSKSGEQQQRRHALVPVEIQSDISPHGGVLAAARQREYVTGWHTVGRTRPLCYHLLSTMAPHLPPHLAHGAPAAADERQLAPAGGWNGGKHSSKQFVCQVAQLRHTLRLCRPALPRHGGSAAPRRHMVCAGRRWRRWAAAAAGGGAGQQRRLAYSAFTSALVGPLSADCCGSGCLHRARARGLGQASACAERAAGVSGASTGRVEAADDRFGGDPGGRKDGSTK